MIEFNIDWVLVLTFVVSTLHPLLVAVVTTKLTSGKVKGLILAALSFVTSILQGILTALIDGTVFDVGQALLVFGGTFAWAVVSYFGIWRAEGAGGDPSIADKINENVGVKL